jgi:hypothetical protein
VTGIEIAPQHPRVADAQPRAERAPVGRVEPPRAVEGPRAFVAALTGVGRVWLLLNMWSS